MSAHPDGSASRAYYAAFYAVSALFAIEGTIFNKHSAINSTVHRDLVKTGRWPLELGEAFLSLREARATGDYGEEIHVSQEEAEKAINAARRILEAVRKSNTETFPADFD